jgi:hypothetical protein
MLAHLITSRDHETNVIMLRNSGPVLAARQLTKEAVIRAGALLIVKMGTQPWWFTS